MKRTYFVVACLLLAFTGCTCGQGWNCWRPMSMFNRLHDRIHGTNVGAPCASGACAGPAMVSAPVMADAGCETCGTGVQHMGYESYPSVYDGGEVIGGSYGGSVRGTTVPSEAISPMQVRQ